MVDPKRATASSHTPPAAPVAKDAPATAPTPKSSAGARNPNAKSAREARDANGGHAVPGIPSGAFSAHMSSLTSTEASLKSALVKAHAKASGAGSDQFKHHAAKVAAHLEHALGGVAKAIQNLGHAQDFDASADAHAEQPEKASKS